MAATATPEAPAFDATKCAEVWESMVPGTIWVWTRDARNPGQYTKTRVGGRGGGSKRLRITTDERRYHEEQVIEEMAGENPFRNGALRLISIDESGRSVVDDIHQNYHLTDAQLIEYFEVKDEDLFKEAMEEIDSELILRRIFSLSNAHGSVSQNATLRDLLEDRYKTGGTQKTVREMIAAGEAIGGEVLSG